MASSVTLSEVQENLPALLDRVERGEEIVIQREGRIPAKIVSMPDADPARGKRIFGQNLLGVTYIAPDFDEPMSEEELKVWGY